MNTTEKMQYITYPRIIAGVFLLYVLDRGTKFWTRILLKGTVDIIPNVLDFTFYKNDKIIFFIEMAPVLQALIMLAVIVLLLRAAISEIDEGHIDRVAWIGVICVGAFSNALDRMQYGYVVDFIRVPFWSVFNLADIYIVVGVIALLWKMRKDFSAV